MTDLELDVWDAWLRERQEHLEETLSTRRGHEEITDQAAEILRQTGSFRIA